jgi:hypothetical protein
MNPNGTVLCKGIAGPFLQEVMSYHYNLQMKCWGPVKSDLPKVKTAKWGGGIRSEVS